MNESTTLIADCQTRCTAKAIPPRWISDVLRRPPTFPPCETSTTESSSSQVSISPVSNESQSDTDGYPACVVQSTSDADISRSQMVDPTHSGLAISQTGSIGSSRTSSAGSTRPTHRASRAEPSSNTPLGWVGWRAYKFHRYLMSGI